EGLQREAPAHRGVRFGLARARYVLADLQVQAGDLAEGKKEVERVIELLVRLKDEEPSNFDYLVALARSYDLRVTVHGQQGDIRSGLTDNQGVLELLVKTRAHLPGTDRLGPPIMPRYYTEWPGSAPHVRPVGIHFDQEFQKSPELRTLM